MVCQSYFVIWIQSLECPYQGLKLWLAQVERVSWLKQNPYHGLPIKLILIERMRAAYRDIHVSASIFRAWASLWFSPGGACAL